MSDSYLMGTVEPQQLTGLRYDNFKIVFMEQRVEGTMRIWAEPFITLRVPKLFNHRSRFRAGARAGIRGPVLDDVQGLSAAAEGGQLQPR
jgi:hypothetical protein